MDVLEALRRYADFLVETPGTGVSLTGGPCPLGSESDETRVDPKTMRKVLGKSRGKASDEAILMLCRTIAFDVPFVRSHYHRVFGEHYERPDRASPASARRDPAVSQSAVDAIVRLAEHLGAAESDKDNLPFTRNRHFTGRVALLDALHETLRTERHATLSSAALKGMGGVGKTHTALEYAYRHRPDYDKILWVHADGEPVLRQSLASLDAVLHLPAEPTLDDRIRGVLEWLSQHSRWLLVVDNAETRDDVARLGRYLAFSGEGAIIVTTRTQAPGRSFVPLEVGTFSSGEGGELLERLTGRHEPGRPPAPAAEALSERLGGLALALEQAGAYMVQCAMGFDEYLALYETRASALLDRASDADYGQSAYRAFAISYERLRSRSALAAELLGQFAMFPPDGFPVRTLFDEYDEIALRDAVWALRDYSLIDWREEEGIVSIHRVVQDIIKDLVL